MVKLNQEIRVRKPEGNNDSEAVAEASTFPVIVSREQRSESSFTLKSTLRINSSKLSRDNDADTATRSSFIGYEIYSSM